MLPLMYGRNEAVVRRQKERSKTRAVEIDLLGIRRIERRPNGLFIWLCGAKKGLNKKIDKRRSQMILGY